MLKNRNEMRFLDGEFWKSQALEELIPFWYGNVIDKEHGAFYTNLSREWHPRPPWDKIPAMISRHIFGFSTAYLLSGEDKYLKVARNAVDYLLEHGWDKQYGGWFSSITQSGKPKDTFKGASSQLYSCVGLTQYYFATADERVLSYVLKSVDILKTKAHDKEHGGYFMSLNRDLTVRDSTKAKHSHYGQGSLMPNLFLATRDKNILSFSEHLADLSIDRMIDPKEGWMLGFPTNFGQSWNYIPYMVDNKETIYLGASSTAALFFLRLYHQSGNESYLKHGKALGDKVSNYGWDAKRGGWFDLVERTFPYRPLTDQSIWWWIQIYGSFIQLQLYHITHDEQYLERFRKSELFYNQYLVDRKYGGVFKRVSRDGSLLGDGAKAAPHQTSYHEMEHGFFNYLHLNLYINKLPAILHFRLDGPKKHFVSPVDDASVQIAEVWINDNQWTNFDAQEHSVNIPPGKNLKVKIKFVSF